MTFLIFLQTLFIVFLLTGGLGYVVDRTTRDIEIIKGLLNKLKECKKLLNIFVYGSGGVLLYLISLIPLFKYMAFLPLFLLTGGILCSGVELGFGLLFNKVLKLDLWYYAPKIKIFGKTFKLHLFNQTDIMHFFLWCLISYPAYLLFQAIK